MIKETSYPVSAFRKDLMPYLKVAKDCGARSCVLYGSSEEYPESRNVVYAYKTYSRDRNVQTYKWDDGQFIL